MIARGMTVSWFLSATIVALAAEPAGALPKPGDYNLPEESRSLTSEALRVPEPPACLPPKEFARRLLTPGEPPVVVLTADRDVPLWRSDSVPGVLEQELAPSWRPTITLAAQPGEFRVFQLGVVPIATGLNEFEIEFSPLAGEHGALAAETFRCLTLSGTLPSGQPLHKVIAVPRGTVKPVWIGLDIPKDARGVYRGKLIVRPAAGQSIVVAVTITVSGAVLAEHGAEDARRLARLRWLDSTIGHEPVVPRGFAAVRVQKDTVVIKGHCLKVGPDGLPAQIESTFSGSNTRADAPPQALLAAPVRFVAEGEAGVLAWRTPASSRATPILESDCAATWLIRGDADGLQLTGNGRLEFDGYARFHLRVVARRDIALRDLRLEIPYAESAARFFLGLNFAGGSRPAEAKWTWDVANNHQDGFWLGAVNNGASWRFRDARYRSALVNIYYPFRPLVEPESWCNHGHGGIEVDAATAGQVPIRVFSGPRTLRRGETLDFDFDVSLTPAKPIDTDRQWRDRIVHPSETKGSDAIEAALADLPRSSATLITIHHRKDENPFINYPYGDAAFPLLCDFVRRAHAQNARVKIYYTTREVTQHLPELWALDSLDGEIICPGPGPAARTVVNKTGPDPWLTAHLRPEFIPAWRATLGGRFAGARDLAVITTPDSRWSNFYLEGLDYLCRHAAIDGIYLDDTALDRESLLRARRILERERPDPHIDLHSWNHFKPLGNFANSALLYTELMPFLDRLWLGEGFDYNRPPDYWLVAVAGIPYGVMSDMLQGGGNPWRGMLFGMTNQLGWNQGDPQPLWHYWDRFGMNGSEMLGWWDAACPVRTDRRDVLATVYRKADRALIALASWSEQDEPVSLAIDWAALGLDPVKIRAETIAIDRFQAAGSVDLHGPVVVPAKRGLLIQLSSE